MVVMLKTPQQKQIHLRGERNISMTHKKIPSWCSACTRLYYDGQTALCLESGEDVPWDRMDCPIWDYLEEEFGDEPVDY